MYSPINRHGYDATASLCLTSALRCCWARNYEGLEEEGGEWSRKRKLRIAKVQEDLTANAIRPSRMKAEMLREKMINIYEQWVKNCF